jgi:hypothetical protein
MRMSMKGTEETHPTDIPLQCLSNLTSLIFLKEKLRTETQCS